MKKEITSAQIYAVFFKDPPQIFKKKRIYGLKVAYLKKPTLGLLHDADMLFIITSRDISEEFFKEFRKQHKKFIIVVFARADLVHLKQIATTYILTKEPTRKIHWYIRLVVEMISLPSYVGLDYYDVAAIFKNSRNMTISCYSNESYNSSIGARMRTDHPNATEALILAYVDRHFRLDYLYEVGEYFIGKKDINIIWAAQHKDNIRGMKCALFAGGKHL